LPANIDVLEKIQENLPMFRRKPKNYSHIQSRRMCYETTAHYRNGRLLSNVKDTHALTTVPPAHPSHAALG
jgi:hypothetical protein